MPDLAPGPVRQYVLKRSYAAHEFTKVLHVCALDLPDTRSRNWPTRSADTVGTSA